MPLAYGTAVEARQAATQANAVKRKFIRSDEPAQKKTKAASSVVNLAGSQAMNNEAQSARTQAPTQSKVQSSAAPKGPASKVKLPSTGTPSTVPKRIIVRSKDADQV